MTERETELLTALRALNAHVEAMQADMVEYVRPGSQMSPHGFATVMLLALDGPEQRAAQNPARELLKKYGDA